MCKGVLEKIKTAVLFCIKWRYLIAPIVFVLCVAFKVHGSSVNEYNRMFANYDEYASESLVLGESRAIRSDEWLVHAPYYMSQQYNNYEKNSNMMSLEGQDMIVGYNAPVLDITLIAKPFTWGYVLLGNEYGLSWYWCSKLILLTLVAFELCMIVTRKNKKVALLGTLMIVFAPTVQWWFVPHMVDVFFWGMAVFVLAYRFFTSEKWLRMLYMVLLPCSVITFVLALFPSLQIPVGLTMLVLFIVCMIRDKKEITFKKKDIWRLVFMAMVVFGVLGYTILTSKEAIKALYSTAYPGKRVSLGGGGGFESLFTDLTSFALPFKDITYSNNCEVSTFIQFAPIFYMIYPAIWKKMKRDKNMIVGNALLICLIVMAAFMLVGFPELLAKLTTFSYINRMRIAYGLIATIFTVWGIDMVFKKQILSTKQIFLVLAIFGFSYVCFVGNEELTYFGWKYYLVVILGLMVLSYLMLKRHQKLFIAGMSLVMIIAGATVNPVARGVSAVFDHPLEQKIKEIAENDKEAYWISSGNTLLAQLGIANGARMLNAVNFYPDFEKWELIDEKGENKEVYNRYAHINIALTDGKTEFILGTAAPDYFNLKLNCNDALKWPVKYVVSAGELKVCNKNYNKIYTDTEGDYYIYEVVKK
ncbi:hypothetical protein J6S55_00045 [Candidatus Saccharibacteria bacterium]|nr:hypothetical protein [Candidatus Saccharibacteria bacterium]